MLSIQYDDLHTIIYAFRLHFVAWLDLIVLFSSACIGSFTLPRRARRCRLAFALFLFAALFSLPPAQAQTLPDCPWPTTGQVTSTVTYTLTQNCRATAELILGGLDADNPITVTINGGGYTVDASALSEVINVIFVHGFTNFFLNNITIVGGGWSSRGVLTINAAATISNTTFRNTFSNAVIASGIPADVTLDNILVENAIGYYTALDHGPAAIIAESNGVLSVNNLVVRNAVGGNSAVGTIRNTDASKRLTMTGCFTADGAWPQVFFGNINRAAVTGECTGTIGNGGSATRQYNHPSASACGLPLAGFVQRNATYNLRSNCQMTGPLYIPRGMTVTINGRGHSIIASGVSPTFIVDEFDAGGGVVGIGAVVTLENPILGAAGTLTIRDAILVGGAPIYGLLRSTLLVERSTLRNGVLPNILADTVGRFNNVRFENNAYAGANTDSRTSVMNTFAGANVTIRDSIFRNNTGGQSVLWAGYTTDLGHSPSLALEGCITFENNSSDYVDFTDIVDSATPPDSYVTDNRTGPCLDTTPIGSAPPSSFAAESPKLRSGSDSSAYSSSKRRVHTCPDLAPEIMVTDLTGATQCQRIEGAGIGIPLVLAAQPVDAVDVWSWIGIGTRVCFQASGLGIVFLDANDAPRSVRVLPAFRLNGMTCANIDDHGSLVLLRDQPSGLPPLTIDDGFSRNLSGCMATLRAILNFRREPGGEVIKWLPAGVKLTVFQQKANWFEVDYHGQRGWVSADYVDTEGNCA